MQNTDIDVGRGVDIDVYAHIYTYIYIHMFIFIFTCVVHECRYRCTYIGLNKYEYHVERDWYSAPATVQLVQPTYLQ